MATIKKCFFKFIPEYSHAVYANKVYGGRMHIQQNNADLVHQLAKSIRNFKMAAI